MKMMVPSSLDHSSIINTPNMSPIEAVVTMSSLESDVAPIMEPVVYQKFGEMELHEEDEDDGSYCPSEADSDDSLEWASETERTMAEDALAEGTVGLDFYGAAVSVATEYVSSYKPVQMGLSMATILPVASIQRAARAARRAGAKGIEGGVDSSPSIITNTINSVLSYLGFSLVSAVEDSSKPHLESGTEPFTPEQEFGEMTLSDYDSDEDADYEPSDSDGSEDELEYNSDASGSEDEVEEEIADNVEI